MQDALESKYNAITLREPPSISHLSRFVNEIPNFATETPTGATQPHKLEDRVLAEIARVPEMQTDYVQYMRLPWGQRTWLSLVEVVRHFSVLEEHSKTLVREQKAFDRNENRQTAPTPKPKGPPAGPLSALPAPEITGPPAPKSKKQKKPKADAPASSTSAAPAGTADTTAATPAQPKGPTPRAKPPTDY